MAAWGWLAMGMVGLQVQWAIEYVFMTPLLLARGMAPSLVSYAWLPSPVLQFFVSPWLGRRSDTCKSRLGRRRPFLMAAAVVATLSMAAIPFASTLGEAAGEDSTSRRAQYVTLSVLITLFVVVDASNSVNEEFQRVLVTDLATTDAESLRGHSVLSSAVGAGGCLGYTFGALPLDTTDLHSDAALLVVIGLAVFLPGTLATLLSAKEQPVVAVAGSKVACLPVAATKAPPGALQPLLGSGAGVPPQQHPSLWAALRAAPGSFRVLCALQLISWMGLWPVWQYTTAFFGSHVYNGDADAAKHSHAANVYNTGVRRGSLALACMAALNTGLSLCVPTVVAAVGSRAVLAGSQVLAGVSFIGLTLTRSPLVCCTLVAVSGVSWAVNNSVPYLLVKQLVPDASSRGVTSNVLYMAQTMPQLVSSVVMGPLISAFGGSFLAPMVVAGGASVAAGVLSGLCLPSVRKETATAE